MGFKQLNGLTHQMESVFDLIRGGQLEVSPELLNILFDCIDFIKQLRHSILGGGDGGRRYFRPDEPVGRSQSFGCSWSRDT